MSLFDLTPECGNEVLPGVATDAYYICRDDIETFPAVVTYATAGDSLRLDGDIVLKAGKKMYKHRFVATTGMVKGTLVGDPGSQAFENSFECRYKNTDAKTLEWITRVTHGCGIIIVKELTGVYRVLGNLDVNADVISAEANSGAKPGDVRGVTATFKDSTGKFAPFYTGVFDLDDSV